MTSLISDTQKLSACLIIIILSTLQLFFPLNAACAKEHKAKTKGKHMSILQKRPVYKLKIDVFGTTHYIKVNGVTILFDVGEDGQTTVTLPINHWMRSGENTIGFTVYPSKRGELINLNSYVRIALLVSELYEPDKVYTVATLHFDGTKDAKGTYTRGSSPSGVYSSFKGFEQDDSGDVRVFDITERPRESFEGSFLFTRKINIPSSLPLWAFFNSEEIRVSLKINEEEFDKARMLLFAEYEKVQNALAKGDIEPIPPMLDERNRETDMAFYLEPGNTAARMREALLEAVNNINENNLELVRLTLDSVGFHLEDNKKIVSLRRSGMDPVIILNFINKKDGLGSERYPMFFRYQDGKYILTR